MKRGEIRSDIAWATPTKVVVHGLDLCEEIVGKMDFGQMAFLQIFGRVPRDAAELRMFNAVMVILVEHGITPSSLATRMTYCGAPEAVQAAVAAGLLGLGSVFVGSLDNAARMLQEAITRQVQARRRAGARAGDRGKPALRARRSFPASAIRSTSPWIPGRGRCSRWRRETGYYGPYAELMTEIGAEAERQTKKALPVNVTGAMAAVASQMDVPWRACRGLAVAARAVGLVGHILEEMRRPMADEIYLRIEHEASTHLVPKT